MGWDSVTEGGSSSNLKVKAGTPAKVHVLNSADGPKSFESVYFQALNKGAIIDPDNNPLEGLDDEFKLRKRHAFIVFDFADSEVKTFVVSNQVANQLKGIMKEYDDSLDAVDLKITRSGEGLATKYQVIPVATKFTDDMIKGKELPDMEEIFKVTSDEDIEKLRNGEDPGGEFVPGDEETPPANAKATPKGKKPPPPAEEETPEDTGGPATAGEDEPPAAEPEDLPKVAPAANTRAGMLAIVKANFTKMSRYKAPKQQMVDIKYFGGAKVMALSQLTTEQLGKLLEYQKKNK